MSVVVPARVPSTTARTRTGLPDRLRHARRLEPHGLSGDDATGDPINQLIFLYFTSFYANHVCAIELTRYQLCAPLKHKCIHMSPPVAFSGALLDGSGGWGHHKWRVACWITVPWRNFNSSNRLLHLRTRRWVSGRGGEKGRLITTAAEKPLGWIIYCVKVQTEITPNVETGKVFCAVLTIWDNWAGLMR